MRYVVAIVAAIALSLIATANTAQAGTDLTTLMAGPWTDYQSTDASLIEGQDGWNALIVTSVQTGPGEVTLVTNINPVSPNVVTQWQGTVAYDSGLVGYVYGITAPFYAVGDTVVFVLTPQSDKLLLSDQTNPSSPSIVLCGPRAPKQTPPPTNHAEVESCAQL